MEKSHEEGTGPVNVIPRVSPSPAICKEWRLEPEMLAVTGKGKGGFGVGERGAAQSASLRGGRGFMEQEGERRAFLVDEAPLPTVPVHQGGSCSLFPHSEEPARNVADETPVTKRRCSEPRGKWEAAVNRHCSFPCDCMAVT